MLNQFVSLEAVWGPFATEMRERLQTAPNVQSGFVLLEQLLLTRLREAPHRLEAVQFGVVQLARQHGALSIRALSDHIGISQNHLLTQFKRMVGSAPKTLARLGRLRHVIQSIDPTQSVDWVWFASRSSYYDQSHLSNDMIAFLGHSPTDYLALRRRLHAANPGHDQLLRFLSVD